MRVLSKPHPTDILSAPEFAAVAEVVRRVRSFVAAEIVQVLLFGSTARGEARADSDLDLLLIFRSLPADREPFATQAEQIAEEVARESSVPTTVWSVSLPDLELGNRTPMLVDALEDAISIWPADAAVPRVPFTAIDALHCVQALLDRLDEGSHEVAERLREGDGLAAAHRGRDDVVRLCTALLLLEGRTRPRRAEAVRDAAARWQVGHRRNGLEPILAWAEQSYGPRGKDEECVVDLPPGGFPVLFQAVETMRRRVIARARELTARLDGGELRPPTPHIIPEAIGFRHF